MRMDKKTVLPIAGATMAVGAAALVYLILVVALRMITREDLKLVPHGEALARLLHIR